MKKLSIALISMILLLVLTTCVQAAGNANVGVTVPEQAKKGETIKAVFEVNASDGSISGIQGKLEYNKEKLEYISNKTILEGWTITGFNKETGIFLVEPTDVANEDTYITETKQIAEFTFKVKEDASSGEANIGISGIILSGAETTNKAVTKTVSIVKEENNAEKNNEEENGKDKTTKKENKLPEAGFDVKIPIAIVITIGIIAISYKKLVEYKDI